MLIDLDNVRMLAHNLCEHKPGADCAASGTYAIVLDMKNESIYILNDALDLRDKLREQIIKYLSKYAYRRQEIIADLVGIRRESIWAYMQGRGLSNISDIQKLYAWMIQDKKNRRRLTKTQCTWLLSNAEKQRRNCLRLGSKAGVDKWERKIRKYQKILSKKK